MFTRPFQAAKETQHDEPPRSRQLGDRGQAVVEMALILPIVVLLVFGALDVGRLFNAQIVVTQAAREGARVAAVECTLNATTCANDVNTRVNGSLSGLNVADSNVTVSSGPYVAGAAVTVQVQYTISLVTPVLSRLIPGSPFTLTGATTMRLE